MTQKQTTFHQNELSIESHPYSHDLAKHFFTSIHQLPWSMLLRSAAEGHPNNRFDILVAKPIARLVTHGDTTIISIDGPESINITSQDDPFSLLHHYQQTLLPTLDSIEDMPFIGGALGYLSYDLGRRIEFLPTTAQQDIPTADMAFGIYEWALIVDHQKNKHILLGTILNNIKHGWMNRLGFILNLQNQSSRSRLIGRLTCQKTVTLKNSM